MSFTAPTGGKVSSTGALDCGASCDDYYLSGASVSLAATPDSGYSFGGWGGDCTAASFNISADMNCTATFSLNSYSVTPSAGTGGSISPASAQSVGYGGTAVFTITP